MLEAALPEGGEPGAVVAAPAAPPAALVFVATAPAAAAVVGVPVAAVAAASSSSFCGCLFSHCTRASAFQLSSVHSIVNQALVTLMCDSDQSVACTNCFDNMSVRIVCVCFVIVSDLSPQLNSARTARRQTDLCEDGLDTVSDGVLDQLGGAVAQSRARHQRHRPRQALVELRQQLRQLPDHFRRLRCWKQEKRMSTVRRGRRGKALLA